MLYYGYQFLGMHLIWWIFTTSYNTPYQMKEKNSVLDILQERFASGQINKEQYQEHNEILERNLAK